MEKILKKVTVFLLATMIFAGLSGVQKAEAAAKTVVVHVKNNADWDSLNVYNWGDGGETAGSWPGTAMKEEGDGWYTYTFQTDYDLHLVFSTGSGSPQSADMEPVTSDTAECWVLVGGKTEEVNKDYGISGEPAKLYTVAEEGWPTVAAKELSKDTDTKMASTANSEASTKDAAADTAEAAAKDSTTDNMPKTGENSAAVWITLAGMLILASAFILLKKRNAAIE